MNREKTERSVSGGAHIKNKVAGKLENMKQTNLLIPGNKGDTGTLGSPIAVCFQDQRIATLFAELIKARGNTPLLVSQIEDAHCTTRVITEPELFEELPAPADHFCLIVGNREVTTPTQTVQLTQPLSEAKIEAALDKFLTSK
jgi:hypothetical protein